MVAVTKRSSLPILKALTLSVAAVFWSAGAVAADLPSWSDGPAKAAIVEFVEGVVTEGHGNFVPVVDRKIGRASCREKCVSTRRYRGSQYHSKKNNSRKRE